MCNLDDVIGGMVPERFLMDTGPSGVGRIRIVPVVKMYAVFFSEKELTSALPDGTAVVSIFINGKFIVYSAKPLNYSSFKQKKILKSNELGARFRYGDNVVVCKN